MGSGPLLAADHGVLRLELDGVDVCQGRLEGRLIPAVAALAEALARLWRGEERSASIAFGAEVELLVARAADEATISLLSQRRPSRLLLRDLRLGFEELVDAVIAAARELASELDPASPPEDLPHGLDASPDAEDARRLGAALEQLQATRRRAPELVPPQAEAVQLRGASPLSSGGPSVSFELNDDDGRLRSYRGGPDLHAILPEGIVELRASATEAPVEIRGSPYLVLRNLVDRGLWLLDDHDREVSVAAAAGAASSAKEGPSPSQPGGAALAEAGSLARAIFAASAAFSETVTSWSPSLGDHPHLRALEEDARERLALLEERAAGHQPPETAQELPPAPSPSARSGPPIAKGALRRISLLPAWSCELPPIIELHGVGAKVWVHHQGGLRSLRMEDGRIEATIELGPLDEIAFQVRRGPFFRLGEGELSCYGAGGDRRWVHGDFDSTRLTFAWQPPGCSVALLGGAGGSVHALSSGDGRSLHHWAPPAARTALSAMSPSLLVVAADNGVVYGLDVEGLREIWKIPLPRALERLTISGGLVVGAARERGAVVLEALHLDNGAPAFSAKVPASKLGDLLPTPDGVLVSVSGDAGGELNEIDGSGRLRWRARPLLGPEPPKVARAGRSILARGTLGACRVERGKVRWNAPCERGGAPVAIRGLVALPGERLEVLDLRSGRPMLSDEAARSLPAADYFWASSSGVMLAADLEGSCVALRLAGGLAVVS